MACKYHKVGDCRWCDFNPKQGITLDPVCPLAFVKVEELGIDDTTAKICHKLGVNDVHDFLVMMRRETEKTMGKTVYNKLKKAFEAKYGGHLTEFGGVIPRKTATKKVSDRPKTRTFQEKERSKLNTKLKEQLFSIYEGKCAVCGYRASVPDTGKPQSYGNQLHHIVPLHNGGTTTSRNMILLCPNHHKDADRGRLTIEELTALASKAHQHYKAILDLAERKETT